ncbi:MAG: HNH endonuclease [Actinomycetales bacterium]|nr:HNH endonuclease [Actinomycetales bacterium]
MGRFEEHYPSLESYWRSVILFGRNVASYKFALGHALLELASEGVSFVPLDTLADPFSTAIARHLAVVDKQGTSSSSRFLDTVRSFNRGEIQKGSLCEATARLGFENVIDAFHVVGGGDIPVRFFQDERKGGGPKGIRLTDDLYKLLASPQAPNLGAEVEARWSLVERAWELNLSRNLVTVQYDDKDGTLFTTGNAHRRVDVTSCRDALNGYQKGSCFYCFRDISIVGGATTLADVDHFFPHALKPFGVARPINGVWNLVLACSNCNRGVGGKSDAIPKLSLLERLDTRNEFLISSHHPLRETLMQQTGKTASARRSFLQSAYKGAVELRVSQWAPRDPEEPRF